jgi:hypothetical protein
VRAYAARLRDSLAELAPREMALLLTAGLVCGVFPINGCPTVLCLIAACVLRLNPAALQLINSASSPLQIALLVPLARIGARLCGAAIPAGGSWAAQIGCAAVHAVAGWACVCVPLGALLYPAIYLSLTHARNLRRAARRGSSSSPTLYFDTTSPVVALTNAR